MSLPDSPNRTIPLALRWGDTGWPVYGLQCALSRAGHAIAPDGDFGTMTEQAVKAYQKSAGLIVDGVAGVATQARLVAEIDTKTHAKYAALPAGLLQGFAAAEGGNNLGAVNWNTGGGVDCGVVQIRCFGPPFDRNQMRVAYDPSSAMDRAASTFLGRADTLRALAYAKTQPREFALRCAALNWNWPYAAAQYATNGGLPDPNRDATWATYIERGVVKRVRFPDGQPVMTWKDWTEFYALGGRHGEGSVTRYVKSWT